MGRAVDLRNRLRSQAWRVLAAGALAAGAVASFPATARACATCTAGDPTLAQMGREPPFAGRVRTFAGLRHLSYRIGRPNIDAVRVKEQRLALGASWSPTDWLTGAMTVPVAWRRVQYANLARDDTFDLGDVDVRLRVVAFRDRAFDPDHMLAVVAGTELATTVTLTDGQGNELPPDAHPGTGSWDPFLGVSYSFLRERFSFFSSLTGWFYAEGIGGLQNGPSLLGTVVGQWQPDRAWGLRLGADLRFQGAPKLRGDELDEGAGTVVWASPGVVFSPETDLVLSGTVRVPVVQALEGAHREGVVVELEVAVDL